MHESSLFISKPGFGTHASVPSLLPSHPHSFSLYLRSGGWGRIFLPSRPQVYKLVMRCVDERKECSCCSSCGLAFVKIENNYLLPGRLKRRTGTSFLLQQIDPPTIKHLSSTVDQSVKEEMYRLAAS